ncbi:MAG: tetratricopeptide repeat protein [Verrucomicrobiales bacterium]|jgi:tetratricopeptide (TPR) repeat protein|nr:tetratricopeptide repeat protein [Verrucomicrobiales bacterium]
MKLRLLALALIVIWGAGKVGWENRLAAERKVVMVGQDLPMSYQLRDSLGQGFTMAALGGFRGLAADSLWLSLTSAWQEQEWERVAALAEMCVLLQPRVAFFWDMGAWNLAWNASVAVEHGPVKGGIDRRKHDARRWIEAGKDLLERGIRVIPEKPILYQRLGDLYWRRLGNYEQAAECYKEALQRPKAPLYLERSVGLMLEKAKQDQAAYEYWRQLWQSCQEHGVDQHRWDMVKEHIQKLETTLAIPTEQRFFQPTDH